MKRIRQVREFSQEEKAQILEANARLLAKREARAKACPSAYIPIRTAGELVTELLRGIPIAYIKLAGRWVPFADAVDIVSIISVTGRPGQRRIKLKIRRKGTDA